MQFITQILSTQTLHFTALVKVSESEHSNETIKELWMRSHNSQCV